MSNEALRLFCSSYMQCIRRMPDQSDQLYNDISQNKDIFQLAINPQLASVIAGLYNQCEGRLPDKRIDLYEKAIETMIDRLVTLTSHLSTDFELNSTTLWSILQEIAEYLHSKVEGLSETVLKQIIRKCLIEQQSSDLDDIITKLVDIFKYQAGLLNEFGHDSFRFIHRTFQEYLAAKSMIYTNGRKRSEQTIYDNLISKIAIPNWRVPLSMTFGILSRSMDCSNLFTNILKRLLLVAHDSPTFIVPFVLIDSLNDMSFSLSYIQYQLIRNLANLLLMDLQNISGFARLHEHQELIHSYFSKLAQKDIQMFSRWFMEKINRWKDLASCANVSYRLRCYHVKYHEIFLNNLCNDNTLWNWPIDHLMQLYSKVNHETIVQQLKLRSALLQNPQTIQYIAQEKDWIRLITALYGGYHNYNTPASILEYYEIGQFLSLEKNERIPFLFFYQEIWGRNNPAYKMAVHLDTVVPKQYWDRKPGFDPNEIYKESFLTDEILQLLFEQKSAMELVNELRVQINEQQLSLTRKIEAMMALIALGDLHFVNIIVKQSERTFLISFANRIEQLISTLKDPIVRCSSLIEKYLHTIYNDMQTNQSNYHIHFIDYCKIYLSLTASAGGLPIDTGTLAQKMDNDQTKSDLYAEYFAFKLTAGFAHSNSKQEISSLVEKYIKSMTSDQLIKTFLKITDAIQLYRPVRAHPWANDMFVFPFHDEQDIPIAFFDCLENINNNLAFIIEDIFQVFFPEGYLHQNVNLIPLVISSHFGMMFKGSKGMEIYKKWIPQLPDDINIKEFLLENIQSMHDPYYKSRGLYQLAEFYDAKSSELLAQSFELAKDIPQAILKFQVLEKLFNAVHYREMEYSLFIQQIVDELVVTLDQIKDPYDRTIASIRLSFYGSGEFRYKYLAHALQKLMQMDEDDQQIKLIIKFKPLISFYDDLDTVLKQFIDCLKNARHQHLVKCHYGTILSTQKLSGNTSHLETEDYTQLQALFSLFAQLSDVRLMIGETETIDQLWINVFRDPHNQSHLTKILEIGLKSELFLTPQVAIVLDELVRQGKEDCVSVLLPYIIRPSDEVLPVVHRWFSNYKNKLIGRFAALLLVEAKRVFESAIDSIIDLLQSDNDQLRYRAQRVFQHPERDVEEPSKRISVIGERTMIKILENTYMKEHPRRTQAYLNTFFIDLLWDDPQVFHSIYKYVIESEDTSSFDGRRMGFFNRIKFVNSDTWNAIMRILQSSSSHPLYVEAILQSAMRLTQRNQITEDNWTEFARVLSTTDTSQFREQLYFSQTDAQIIQFIVDEVCALTTVDDEIYFELLQSKLISTSTVRVEDLSRSNYAHINLIRQCNFFASDELNETILNILNNIPLNRLILENFIKWLIHQMASFKSCEDSYYSLMLTDCLLSLVSGCAQKENYLYRKITNAPHVDKLQMIKLLQHMLDNHPFFPARGSAFILLAALAHTDHQVIINALNTLSDENYVKEYTMIGIPLIHLPPNELLDDLLSSLTSESAVKTYEILKILTQFALDEQIDANGKSKIINCLAKEIGRIKSKSPVNYYYTYTKIPFTTTLENELYKAWIKIQGLSGKTQYARTHRST